MSLKPKPQSWDDVKPGDVITWTVTKWSHKLGRNTERPRRLLVRVVGGPEPKRGDTIRVVQGILVTKTDAKHGSMNNYPLTDADNVSTGEMGACVVLPLGWITSLDRPAYVEEPKVERYETVKLDRDGKWHVFDTRTSAEITLAGLDTKREALTLVEELRQPKTTPVACLAMGDRGGAPTGRHAHMLADSVECNPAFEASTVEAAPAVKPVKLTEPQPAVLPGRCGKDEPHEAHQWPNIVKGGIYACEGVKPAPRTMLELINAYANATGERPKLRAEIERRIERLRDGDDPDQWAMRVLDGQA